MGRFCTYLVTLVVLSYYVCVTPSSAEQCTCMAEKVDCSKRAKSSIESGELCFNVSKIDLSENALTSFPNGLQYFENIYIRSNHLTSLPNSALLNPEIMVLNLASNNISNTADEFRNLSHLIFLNINENKISSLEFLPDPCVIGALNAESNLISSLEPIRRCNHMTNLNLGNNKVTEISSRTFQGMSELEMLDLDHNPLEVLALGAFRDQTNLKLLFLRDGHLTHLPDGVFSNNLNLKMLLLSENNLTTLPENVFDGLYNLKEVGVRENKLSELPVLRNCCTKLEDINFGWNLISSPSEEAVRSYLQNNMTVLDLRGNPLQPMALRWAVEAADIEVVEDVEKPACGELRLVNKTRVRLCLPVGNARWVQAVSEVLH